MIPKIFIKKIKTKLIIGVALVHAVLMSLFIFDHAKNQKDFFEKQSIETISSLSKSLALSSVYFILSNDLSGIEQLIDSYSEYPNLKYMMIISTDGKVLGHNFKENNGKYIVDDVSKKLFNTDKKTILINNSLMIDFAYPVLFYGKLIGWARIAINNQILINNIKKTRVEGFIYTLTAILAGMLMAWFISIRLTVGLNNLLKVTKSIGKKTTDLRADIHGEDEITELSINFNNMLNSMSERERLLRESEERLSLVIDAARLGLWDWDMATGYLKLDAIWVGMLGYELSDIEPNFNSFQKLLHPDDFPLVMDKFNMHANEKTPYYEAEFRLLAKSGDWKWINAKGKVVKYSEDSVPLRAVGVHIDITENKKILMDLEIANARFEGLMSSIQHGILVEDIDRRIVFVNDSFCDLFNINVPKENLINFSCIEAAQQAKNLFRKPENFIDLINNMVNDAKAVSGVILYLNDGRFFEQDFVPIKIENKLSGYLWIYRDITERKIFEDTISKQKEELEEANLNLRNSVSFALKMKETADKANIAKSDFLANMSHEIRTPMNGILGTVNLFNDTRLTMEQKEFLDIIKISAEHLLSIINDILDFSKIESGKLELDNIDFDLNEIFEYFDILVQKAVLKGLDINFYIEPDVPLFVRGDKAKLLQIILNLLSNAIKFTEKDDIFIKISLLRKESDSIQIKISVKDTGVGISKDKIFHIFEPFEQADTSITRKYGGTGLGLAISKKLVKIMHGEIGFNSIEGKGSEFWFTTKLHLQKDIKKYDLQRFSSLRVIIACNNQLYRQILRDNLKFYNIEVTETDNINVILTQLTESTENLKPYDIAIIDVNLDISKILLKKDKLKTKIIFSGYFNQRHLAGEKDLFLKIPVKRTDLYNILSNVSDIQPELIEYSLSGDAHEFIGNTELTHNILLVEDNHINRFVVISILKKLGFDNLHIAKNGVEAIEKIKNNNFDIVFMDCQMPEMDGFEAVRRIRNGEAGEQNKALIIVALTAHAMKGDRERCLDSGMNDYLAKPVSQQSMASILNNWLKLSLITDKKSTKQDLNASNIIFDYDNLLLRFSNDKELIKELLVMFLEEMPEKLNKLKNAVNDLNFGIIEKVSHSIKGNSAHLSAMPLSLVAYEIEKNARLKNINEIKILLKKIISEFKILKNVMEDRLKAFDNNL